jgi:hypothetical protein
MSEAACATSDSLASPDSKQKQQLVFETQEELLAILSQRHEVDLNAEDMDPLEWTFRKVVPVPKFYYWDVLKQQHHQPQQQEGSSDAAVIPMRIKLWHHTIATMTGAYQWTEQKVALPLARTFGLTSSRFDDVAMYMTEDDRNASRRIVAERQQKECEQQLEQPATSESLTSAKKEFANGNDNPNLDGEVV